ncbi:MAG: hypothetical protein V7L20_00020 [Nostoc sp.]
MTGERRSTSRMHLSEVMTIAMASPTPRANAFHGSGYRTFKEFYTLHVLPGWHHAFSNLVSLGRGRNASLRRGLATLLASFYR